LTFPFCPTFASDIKFALSVLSSKYQGSINKNSHSKTNSYFSKKDESIATVNSILCVFLGNSKAISSRFPNIFNICSSIHQNNSCKTNYYLLNIVVRRVIVVDKLNLSVLPTPLTKNKSALFSLECTKGNMGSIHLVALGEAS